VDTGGLREVSLESIDRTPAEQGPGGRLVAAPDAEDRMAERKDT
jgi:hypothetical protein